MYKTVVIGAGPAGYSAAIRLAQLGAKVALVEKYMVGGICINWGCTPSKAMISAAKVYKTTKMAGHFGIKTGELQVDFPQIAKRRDTVMAKAREHIKRELEYWQVPIVAGEAEIIDSNHVKVNEQLLETENIIIATGSTPLIPPFLQKHDPSIINSDRLITINELPSELTIIGGGIIGLEFATVFSNLGTKVRVIELLDRCLAILDPEISARIEAELKANGVEILTGHKVLDIAAGQIKLEKVASGEQYTITSPLNLIAIGRKAQVDKSQMAALGIATDNQGIVVNDYLQTSKTNIYAIGDATGRSILAHVAIQQGIIAAENIMGKLRQMKYDVIPAVVYTLPEVAAVGSIPTDNPNLKTVTFPLSANLRAVIEEHESGFVKLWYEDVSYKLLAVQVIGFLASEVIQGYANIIALNLPLAEVANIIHAHPTYNELVRNSLELILGRSLEHHS